MRAQRPRVNYPFLCLGLMKHGHPCRNVTGQKGYKLLRVAYAKGDKSEGETQQGQSRFFFAASCSISSSLVWGRTPQE
jgi:hypothetical protein